METRNQRETILAFNGYMFKRLRALTALKVFYSWHVLYDKLNADILDKLFVIQQKNPDILDKLFVKQHITVAHFSWLFLVVDIWVDQSCNILIKCCMIKEHIDIGFFKEKTFLFILGNPMGQREGEFHPPFLPSVCRVHRKLFFIFYLKKPKAVCSFIMQHLIKSGQDVCKKNA